MTNIRMNEANREMIVNIIKKSNFKESVRILDHEFKLVEYANVFYIIEIQYSFCCEEEDVVTSITKLNSPLGWKMLIEGMF